MSVKEGRAEDIRMKNRKKGFTLVELMVVIVIMAILAAAATPIFTGYVRKAKAAEHLSECRSIYIAAQTLIEEAYINDGDGSLQKNDLDMEKILEELESLTGISGICEGTGKPGSGQLTEKFYVYFEEKDQRMVCTAVVYCDSEDSVWIFDTEKGTYTEAG